LLAGMSKEEILDRIEKSAYECEKEYHGCSRCTLRALEEHLELRDGSALKAATPLAGGIAMMGETCGALLGALIAIGLATASDHLDNEAAFMTAMASGYRFYRQFEKEFGSAVCRDIQKERFGRSFNFADAEQYQAFQEAGGYEECPKVAAKAARLAGEFILELGEEAKRVER
jgi:C_GCAxxG_C_C family probable redox protein